MNIGKKNMPSKFNFVVLYVNLKGLTLNLIFLLASSSTIDSSSQLLNQQLHFPLPPSDGVEVPLLDEEEDKKEEKFNLHDWEVKERNEQLFMGCDSCSRFEDGCNEGFCPQNGRCEPCGCAVGKETLEKYELFSSYYYY